MIILISVEQVEDYFFSFCFNHIIQLIESSLDNTTLFLSIRNKSPIKRICNKAYMHHICSAADPKKQTVALLGVTV